MKIRFIFILTALMLLCILRPAAAEPSDPAIPAVSDAPQDYLVSFDLAPIEQFAAENAPEMDLRATARAILHGEADLAALADILLQRLREPLDDILSAAARAAGPVALLILSRSTLHGDGARFLLRLSLLATLLDASRLSISAAAACLHAAASFTNTAAPVLAALMTATGMTASASLISPAAAMAGGIVERLFISLGLPLCRAALCTACASGFGEGMRLNRLTALLRRSASLLVGLSFTLFTALIALQGSVSVRLDGLSLRTAKFAVDSAAPIIGSGMSDAWESYVAGVAAARSAVGVSGMLLLLITGAQPVLRSLGVMLLLQLCAVLLELFGEETSARACEQLASVSRMTLELSTGALAIAMILLGSLVFFTRSLAA